MIGLPTITSSRIVLARRCRRRARARRPARRAPRARRASSPPRRRGASSRRRRGSSGPRRSGSAGSSRPARRGPRRSRGRTGAPAIVVEPTSIARPNARSWKPGQTAMIARAVVHRDGDRPVARAQRRLERRSVAQVDARGPASVPLALRAPRCEPLEVAARSCMSGSARPRRSAAGRPDRARSSRTVGALAHDLAVDLALGRHVDDDVAARPARVQRQPAVRRRGPALAVALPRRRANGVRCVGGRRDAVLGEAPARRRPGSGRRSPRPPQTESMSTPSCRAPRRARSCRPRTAAPARRREDDERHPRGSAVALARRGRRPARRPRAPRARRRAGRGDRRRSAGASRNRRIQRARVRVVAHQHVGGHDRGLDLGGAAGS